MGKLIHNGNLITSLGDPPGDRKFQQASGYPETWPGDRFSIPGMCRFLTGGGSTLALRRKVKWLEVFSMSQSSDSRNFIPSLRSTLALVFEFKGLLKIEKRWQALYKFELEMYSRNMPKVSRKLAQRIQRIVSCFGYPLYPIISELGLWPLCFAN